MGVSAIIWKKLLTTELQSRAFEWNKNSTKLGRLGYQWNIHQDLVSLFLNTCKDLPTSVVKIEEFLKELENHFGTQITIANMKEMSLGENSTWQIEIQPLN